MEQLGRLRQTGSTTIAIWALPAFVRDTLVPQGFSRNKVVYINLDAFWSNLDAVQLADAVAEIKAMRGADGTRFEPGIYWTPFAYWSDDLDAYVEGTGMKYRYRDILLKAPDGSILPKVDGGLAIDPSHPGDEGAHHVLPGAISDSSGFTYLKLDFLSHGALEGVHFDPAIQTGIEAYNLGMKQIADEAGKPHVSQPLYRSAFSVRVRSCAALSCDTKGHISGGDQIDRVHAQLTDLWLVDRREASTSPIPITCGSWATRRTRARAV